MRLTDAEKALLEGNEGLARQKTMELLVRYGEALGVERLVDTNNVCVSVTAGAYSTARPATKESDIDADAGIIEVTKK